MVDRKMFKCYLFFICFLMVGCSNEKVITIVRAGEGAEHTKIEKVVIDNNDKPIFSSTRDSSSLVYKVNEKKIGDVVKLEVSFLFEGERRVQMCEIEVKDDNCYTMVGFFDGRIDCDAGTCIHPSR